VITRWALLLAARFPWLRFVWAIVKGFAGTNAITRAIDAFMADKRSDKELDVELAIGLAQAEAEARKHNVELDKLRYDKITTLIPILAILWTTAGYWAIYMLSKILHRPEIEPWELTGVFADSFVWVVITLIGGGAFGTLFWVNKRR